MVLDENNQKWACTSCVRGHRSAKCGHTDRWLVAVRPSGRPRTSGCDHPNPDNCDCQGIRKVLMVAIPNDKRCTCTGDHTCYKGKLLHTARVAKEEETPDIPQDVLQKRNSINEAYRAGGLPYAAQLFPDFFSNLPIAIPPGSIPDPRTQTAASAKSPGSSENQAHPGQISDGHEQSIDGLKIEDTVQTMPLGPTSTNATGSFAPKSATCCGPQDSEVNDESFKAATSVAPLQTYDMQSQLYDHGGAPSGIGSYAHPWTADDFHQSIFQQQVQAQQARGPAPYLDSFNCQCGEGCDCTGCLAHPFNPSMQEEVGSLVPLMAQDSAPLNLVDGSYEFSAHNGFQYPSLGSPDVGEHPSIMSPIHPTFIDSSNFSHFQYEVTPSAFGAVHVDLQEPFNVDNTASEQHSVADGLRSRTTTSCCASPPTTVEMSFAGEQHGQSFPSLEHRAHGQHPMADPPYQWPPDAAIYQQPTTREPGSSSLY